jgi:hypothetical protein
MKLKYLCLSFVLFLVGCSCSKDVSWNCKDGKCTKTETSCEDGKCKTTVTQEGAEEKK